MSIVCCGKATQIGCPEAWTWECCENPFIDLVGFVDPPQAPKGYKVQVKYDSYMGFVTHYRFVRD